MSHPLKRAVIYTRTISDKKSKYYASREKQLSYCKQYAAEQELEVIHCYHEYGPSGKEISRPALRELLQMIATESNIEVLVTSLDRLGRDILTLSATLYSIQLLGARVVDISDKYMGSME